MSKRTIGIGLLAAAIAAIGAAGGYWFARHGTGTEQTTPAATEHGSMAPSGTGKVLYWYDPMHPDKHFDQPGKSPFMDMPLTPRYAEEGGGAAAVSINPGVEQNLGIRLAVVERTSLMQPIEAAANVVFNDRNVAIVQARSNGFVERVYARASGDVIARGAPIVDLLMPEWSGAQQEFLALLKSGDKDLVAAARERLRLLGMPDELIARVERTGQPQSHVTIAAPVGGVIQALDIRAGMAIAAGATLARISSLDTVWIEAAVPEAQGGRVAPGRMMEARLAAYPGDTFRGKIIAILPDVSADSRTLRVRIELPNPDGRLRPGMFARVRLETGKGEPVLVVPSEAVIVTGRRSIVIVAAGSGKFQPVGVQTGQEADGRTAILSGLQEGQQVVASGQFLIDSEANLNGALARLGGSATATSPEKHAGHVLHRARGKIESVSSDEISISHGAIESLGWEPMTMTFQLARPGMADAFREGDTVDFAFRQEGDDYIVEKLEKAGGGK